MSDVQTEYDKLVNKLTTAASAEPGQMLGKICLKINGKAFVAWHR
ncbi:hypothetical protein ACO0LG_06175 [Undibacterium sp. Ji42W]